MRSLNKNRPDVQVLLLRKEQTKHTTHQLPAFRTLFEMRRYALVAIGGGFGSLLRFAITQWMAPMPVWSPLSILLINVSGCFLIAFLNFVSDPAGEIYLGPNSRIFLMVGVCGGYTTFSTFSLISFNALRHNAVIDLWLNIGLSHLLCLLAIWIGALLASGLPRALATIARWLRS
jgi:fluoride exporter